MTQNEFNKTERQSVYKKKLFAKNYSRDLKLSDNLIQQREIKELCRKHIS